MNTNAELNSIACLINFYYLSIKIMSGNMYSNGANTLHKSIFCDSAFLIGPDVHLLQIRNPLLHNQNTISTVRYDSSDKIW
jgi:hypothetical protein